VSVKHGGVRVRSYDAHIFHLRDGKVVEFWNGSTDPYAYDELFGWPGCRQGGAGEGRGDSCSG
jgi:ketosteroid isomerase-like protein